MYPPENYAETPDGLLLMADGLSPVQLWDGLSAAAQGAGLAAPAAAPALAASGSGTATGTYFAFARFVDALGNVSDLSPVSAAVTAASALTFAYTSVPTTTDPKVARRQLLRNTAGQANVFYVDVDTTDLTSTSFSSTLSDSLLQANEAVPLLDVAGRVFADSNGVPPAHKAALAHHLGRMFATGEVTYSRGCVSVTAGSALVSGVNTEWTASLAGRVLYVVGAASSYEVASVDVAGQTLTLTTNYAGGTDAFAAYAIRPQPAERRLVYYSEAGKVQSWPAFNAIEVQEDGDELTGLMVMGSFLYLLERRHIYRFTFQTDPARDGATFLAANRGCINQRCFVVAEGTAYLLDEGGVHAFTGAEEVDPVSATVQDLFVEGSGQPLTVNWQASDTFHAAHSPQDNQIRWFVAMSGDRYPRHALCYEYRYKRWWLEEYPRPVSSSCTGTYEGHRRVFLGSTGKRTYLFGVGNLDGVDPAAGSTRGAVTSASAYRLTDAQASFPPSGVVGSPVAVVSGRGKGQVREVVSVSGQTLTLKTPWLVLPDSTSTYQLGGVPWSFQTGWRRWLDDESENPRRVEVLFEPSAVAGATFSVQVLKDFGGPVTWKRTLPARAGEGMAVTSGSPELEVDLTRASGFAQQSLNGNKEYRIDGWRHVALRLSGFTQADAQAVYEVTLDGVRGPGRGR